MTFTQDTRNSSSLSQDSRTAAASITQDSKTVGDAIWSSTMLPWQMDFPWLWAANGSLLTLDIRN